MSQTLHETRPGTYLDSVALMRVSVEAQSQAGVEDAALMMGTPANLELMTGAGLIPAGFDEAGPSDLVIAVRAVDQDSAEQAMDAARAGLQALTSNSLTAAQGGQAVTGSLGEALEAMPAANLALVSIPGAFAAAEAAAALDAGLDVMIFSDNVPVEEERALKERAAALGRLVMGPDCGTALIAGAPLGFANVIPRGEIGVVAASGTGLQELGVLLAPAGLGLSHGIGIGGRDLSEVIGGISCLSALERLAADPATRQIVVLSKPPADEVAAKVLETLAAAGKPASVCFLGHAENGAPEERNGITVYSRIVDLAEALAGEPVDSQVAVETAQGDGGGTIRGLFAGGTLCAEAQQTLLQAGEPVASNASLPRARDLAQMQAGDHQLIDLGADEYTQGRPHPMLEPTVRSQPLAEALADPQVGAILVDVVLGYGAHPDPAGMLVRSLEGAPGKPVIASLCGTAGDPQGFERQWQTLTAAGITVQRSAARACEAALSIIRGVRGAGSRT